MWVSVKRGWTVLNSIRECLKFFSYNFFNEIRLYIIFIMLLSTNFV